MASRGVELAQRGVPSKMIAGKRKAHSRWTRSHTCHISSRRCSLLGSCDCELELPARVRSAVRSLAPSAPTTIRSREVSSPASACVECAEV